MSAEKKWVLLREKNDHSSFGWQILRPLFFKKKKHALLAAKRWGGMKGEGEHRFCSRKTYVLSIQEWAAKRMMGGAPVIIGNDSFEAVWHEYKISSQKGEEHGREDAILLPEG